MMRACPLRAGFSKTASASAFVLGNPKAWLGTAYHAVLEKIAAQALGQEPLDAVVERLWAEAISQQEATIQGHALNVRFGRAPTWPGYHLARASVGIRAAALVEARQRGPRPATDERNSAHQGKVREHRFTAYGGKLVGYPDVIRGDEIIDYKSGAIVEYDDVLQADVIKAAYVSQLRIYGALVKENRGTWPSRGILLPPVGPGVEIPLEPSECIQEAEDAVARLDEFNQRLAAASDPRTLATPSPTSCKWCSYKLVCPAFWAIASPSWSGQLDGGAIEAEVAERPQPAHGGAAFSVAVRILRGSEARREASLTPLNPAAHPLAGTLVVGEQIRAVGLRIRADDTLVPMQRTVLHRVSELPAVATAPQHA